MVHLIVWIRIINLSIKLLERNFSWNAGGHKASCQLSDIYEIFLRIIPGTLTHQQKKSPKDFTRKRNLTLPKIITFILSFTASGNKKGIDIHLSSFFKNARRSNVWMESKPAHRSAVSKARSKVNWAVFENILDDANKAVDEVWPDRPEFTWHGMTVVAFDGSKYKLPATPELRKIFDPNSGLQNPGKGHYPQCVVHTAYDVFRRIPLARTITGASGSEPAEALKMLPKLPQNSVLLFDRGYPSFGLIKELSEKHNGFYLMRCKTAKTFPAVQEFIAGTQKEAVLSIKPSRNYVYALPKEQRARLSPLKVRAIRMTSPDGNDSVLLTNLFDHDKYSADNIIELYFRRWEVEDHYRNEKVVMEIEKFHAKTENGILQELFASCIMTTISRTLMILSQQVTESKAVEPQFTHALNAVAVEAAILVPDHPERAIELFVELIEEIARVKYYRSRIKRPSQPRITKKPIGKWIRYNRKRYAKTAASA
jgi:hypothetical protein